MSFRLSVFLMVAFTIIGYSLAADYLTERPSFLKICRQKDPNLNTCLADNLQAMFSEWSNGIPGSKTLRKIDPLNVKRLAISNESSGAVSVKAELTDIEIIGLSKLKVDSASADLKNYVFQMQLNIPSFVINSMYKLKGNVLAFALNGSGKSRFAAKNTILSTTMKLKLRHEKDVILANIVDLEAKIKDIGDLEIQLDNLFNGRQELEKTVNEVFNENWRDLFEVLRPNIERTVKTIFKDRLERILNYVPTTFFIDDITP